jgi:hypothetical protein
LGVNPSVIYSGGKKIILERQKPTELTVGDKFTLLGDEFPFYLRTTAPVIVPTINH